MPRSNHVINLGSYCPESRLAQDFCEGYLGALFLFHDDPGQEDHPDGHGGLDCKERKGTQRAVPVACTPNARPSFGKASSRPR